MGDTGVGPGDVGAESDLADVSGLPLAEILPSGDAVLARSLRRLLSDMDQAEEIIAAFANYAGGGDQSEPPASPPADPPPPR